MVGIVPIFYHIPITPELIKCVQAGRFLTEPTIVQKCIPPVPDQDAYYKEGLVPLANQCIVIQCFEAFKAYIVSLAQCPQLSVINLPCDPGHMIHLTCNKQHGGNFFHSHNFIKHTLFSSFAIPTLVKFWSTSPHVYLQGFIHRNWLSCHRMLHGIKQPPTETYRPRSDHLALTCSGICRFFAYTPVPASLHPEFVISSGSSLYLSG